MIYIEYKKFCPLPKLSSFLILLAQNNFGVKTGELGGGKGLLRS